MNVTEIITTKGKEPKPSYCLNDDHLLALVDDEKELIECDNCGTIFSLSDVRKTDAHCPTCLIPFRILDATSLEVVAKPSRKKTSKKHNRPPILKTPYHEYLQSEHWQSIRKAALKAADNRCQLCYSDLRLEVHHRTYERRGCELLSDLTVLCHRCHAQFHGIYEEK